MSDANWPAIIAIFLVGSLGTFFSILILVCLLWWHDKRNPFSNAEPRNIFGSASDLIAKFPQNKPIHCSVRGHLGLYYHHFVITIISDTMITRQEYKPTFCMTIRRSCCGRSCPCPVSLFGGQLQRETVFKEELFETSCCKCFCKHQQSIIVHGDELVDDCVVECVERLNMRPGEPLYHPRHNNCEHYANWVMREEHISYQLEDRDPDHKGLSFLRLFLAHSIGRFIQYATFNCGSGMLKGFLRPLVRIGLVLLNSIWVGENKPFVELVGVGVGTFVLEGLFLFGDLCMFSHLSGCCLCCYADFPLGDPSVKMSKKNKSPQIETSTRVRSTIFISYLRVLLDATAIIGGAYWGHAYSDEYTWHLEEILVDIGVTLFIHFVFFPLIAAAVDMFWFSDGLKEETPKTTAMRVVDP